MLVGEPGEKTLRTTLAQASFETWDYDDYVGGAGLRCVSDRLR